MGKKLSVTGPVIFISRHKALAESTAHTSRLRYDSGGAKMANIICPCGKKWKESASLIASFIRTPDNELVAHCPECRELLELGREVKSLEVGQELWHCPSDWAVATEMLEGFDDYGEPATFLDVEGRGHTPLEALRAAKKGKEK